RRRTDALAPRSRRQGSARTCPRRPPGGSTGRSAAGSARARGSWPASPFRRFRLTATGNVFAQKAERRTLLFAAGLVHEHGELAELGFDLVQRQEVGARGEDGRLNDGMLRPVEAEKVAQPPAVDHLRLDADPLLAFIHRDDPEFVVAAGVAEDVTTDV